MADEAKILELIEIARDTGKIRKGANEATKAIEKGDAKLVAYAQDVSPKEVVMHLPLLCKEKNVFCVEVGSKESLGAAAGLSVGTSAVAVVREGDAKSGIESIYKSAAPKEEKKPSLKKESKPAEKTEAEPKKAEKKAVKNEDLPAEEQEEKEVKEVNSNQEEQEEKEEKEKKKE